MDKEPISNSGERQRIQPDKDASKSVATEFISIPRKSIDKALRAAVICAVFPSFFVMAFNKGWSTVLLIALAAGILCFLSLALIATIKGNSDNNILSILVCALILLIATNLCWIQQSHWAARPFDAATSGVVRGSGQQTSNPYRGTQSIDVTVDKVDSSSSVAVIAPINGSITQPLAVDESDIQQSGTGTGGPSYYSRATSPTTPSGTITSANLPAPAAVDYGKLVKPTDYGFFCFSIVLCVVAFFILEYSIQLHSMMAKGNDAAPSASLGSGSSFLLLAAIIGTYFFYWFSRHANEVLVSGNKVNLWPLLQSPREFAPALLLASIAPCLIALSKFACVLSILPATTSDAVGGRRTIGPLVGALLALINLACNLIALRDFLKAP